MADIATTRRQVAAELRRIRSMRGLNQRQVAEAMDWSPSKILRIEKADVSISVTDLRALLGFYGVVDEAVVGDLVERARSGRRRMPGSAYRDIFPPDVIRFLDYERSASRLIEVQLATFPGLLQTEAYTRAWLGGVLGMDSPRIERIVASRRERQRLLSARPAPRMVFLIDEAILCRVIGDARVMREQLDRLVRLAELPHVEVRILPFSAGGHGGLRGSFVLLSFPEVGDPDVVYAEHRRGDSLFRDDPGPVEAFRGIAAELDLVAAPAQKLPGYVERALDRVNLPSL